MSAKFNPLSIAYHKNRYDHYVGLRREHPVYFSAEAGVWVVSRFADIDQVLGNPAVYSSSPQQAEGFGFATDVNANATPEDIRRMQTLLSALPFKLEEVANSRMLIGEDPPRHSLMRKVFGAAFLSSGARSWESTIRDIAAPCIEKLKSAKEFDVIADLGAPIPLKTIVSMLGADLERANDFKVWADEMISAAVGADRKTEVAEERLGRNLIAFSQYFRPLIDERRQNPGADLISLVLKAQDSEARVTDFEVVLFVILLLLAGNETTTNLITNMIYELLQNDEQLAKVIADHSLIPGLIEETLRYRSPVQQIFRKATRDAELAGQKIPKDALMVLLLGSANRDENQWPEAAERYEAARPKKRNMAFGAGAHTCIGMHLARLEARIALEGIVDELPNWKLAHADNHLIDNFMVWGYHALPIVRKS